MSLLSRTVLSRLVGLNGNGVTTTLLSPSRTYKSSISLDKLYPQSSCSISRIPEPPKNEPGKFSGYIPMEKIEISFSRSSGPGGMNVNKLNTKATLKFKIDEANWIPDDVLQKFKDKFQNQITKEGILAIQSDRTRYQHHNVADALQKLREMIRSCEEVHKEPTPEDLEKQRRLKEKVARERLLIKKTRSFTKQSRGAV